jgi:hypothetical protein
MMPPLVNFRSLTLEIHLLCSRGGNLYVDWYLWSWTMFLGPGNIFQTVSLWYNTRQYCTIQNTIKTGEKNLYTKVDLLQFQFVTTDCTILIPNKKPTTQQGRDVCAIYSTFICRQLGDNTESEFLHFFKDPRNRFQVIKSSSLCSLAGGYDNPIRTRVPTDCLKIPSQLKTARVFRSRGYNKYFKIHCHLQYIDNWSLVLYILYLSKCQSFFVPFSMKGDIYKFLPWKCVSICCCVNLFLGKLNSKILQISIVKIGLKRYFLESSFFNAL